MAAAPSPSPPPDRDRCGVCIGAVIAHREIAIGPPRPTREARKRKSSGDELALDAAQIQKRVADFYRDSAIAKRDRSPVPTTGIMDGPMFPRARVDCVFHRGSLVASPIPGLSSPKIPVFENPARGDLRIDGGFFCIGENGVSASEIILGDHAVFYRFDVPQLFAGKDVTDAQALACLAEASRPYAAIHATTIRIGQAALLALASSGL